MSKDGNKAKQAVAYLLSKPEERPKELAKLLGKLDIYGESGQKLEAAINQARQSLDELFEQMSQLKGSINAVYDLAVEDMTDEQVEKFSKEAIPPIPEAVGQVDDEADPKTVEEGPGEK